MSLTSYNAGGRRLPTRYGNCGCMCHRLSGVHHVTACCWPGRDDLSKIEPPFNLEIPVSNDYIRNWDDFWMGMAHHVARKSKDPSVKLGVVLVTSTNDLISIGYNGFPRGVRELLQRPGTTDAAEQAGALELVPGVVDPARWEKRPEKYRWVEHAERNAVYNAARLGRSTLGSIAYINAEPTPCADCTRSFIQAGVYKIVGLDAQFRGKGVGVHYHCGDIENTMLDEAGIVRVRMPVPPVDTAGRTWGEEGQGPSLG